MREKWKPNGALEFKRGAPPVGMRGELLLSIQLVHGMRTRFLVVSKYPLSDGTRTNDAWTVKSWARLEE